MLQLTVPGRRQALLCVLFVLGSSTAVGPSAFPWSVADTMRLLSCQSEALSEWACKRWVEG